MKEQKLTLPPNANRKLLLPPHHSVSDWDKTPGATYLLDTSQYVSEPRSLRQAGPGSAGGRHFFLARPTPTLVLPQGRIVTYHRSQDPGITRYLIFRDQSPLGSVNDNNHYELRIQMPAYELFRTVAGVNTLIATIDIFTTTDMWYQERWTWWNGLTPEGQDALTFMIERYFTGEWQQQGDWIYDTANQFKDSAINRCGIGTWENEFIYCWWDDTEIWGPL